MRSLAIMRDLSELFVVEPIEDSNFYPELSINYQLVLFTQFSNKDSKSYKSANGLEERDDRISTFCQNLIIFLPAYSGKK